MCIARKKRERKNFLIGLGLRSDRAEDRRRQTRLGIEGHSRGLESHFFFLPFAQHTRELKVHVTRKQDASSSFSHTQLQEG